MNKILRYSLLALLAFVSNLTFAETVTFTAGETVGKNTSASGSDTMTKDGITIDVSAGGLNCVNGATNEKEYRFGKGCEVSFTSTVGKITKVEFTCTAKDDEKFGPANFKNPSVGEFTSAAEMGTWTGDAANFSIIASVAQVRATKIVITYTPGKVDPPVQEEEKVLKVSEAIDILTAKEETKKAVLISGIVSKIDEISVDHGNATYYISDDGKTDKQLMVYRGKYFNNANFTAEDQLKVGDKITISGVLTNYTDKNQVTTQEVKSSQITILNDVTAINEVKATVANNAVVYNLAGQQVSNNFKGVVIVNGKKFIQK